MRTSKENKNGTGGAECSGAETSEEMFARFNKEEKEKVYCKNCRYFKKVYYKFQGYKEKCYAPKNSDFVENYYSPYTRYFRKPEIINSDNDCRFHKRKWWKFGVKENKRKILKGSQPKTKAGPKPEIILSITLEKYLDKAITKWRNELGISKTKEDKLIAKCNIDTYQSVRVSMLGELLPKEEK